jgi:HSP20 family molecular chaperone IbpA
VCSYPHNVNAEVIDYDDEVMVTIDIIPGMDITGIRVSLVSPDTLSISCDRTEKISPADDGYHPREQRSFSLHHRIPLPAPVTRKGARSILKNGVLDFRFKKVLPW